jgi:MFS family permease
VKIFRELDASLRRNLLVLFTAGLLFWTGLALLLPVIPLYVEAIGGTKQQVGIVSGSFAIGLLLFRPMLGQLADRRGRKIVLLIGMSVSAIAPLGYLLLPSIPVLIIVRAFHGICLAAFSTGFGALVADLAPEKSRGEVIGYMSLVTPIGLAMGPALGGYLQQTVGYTLLFLLSAGLGFLGLLCTCQIVNPLISEQPQDTSPNFWRMLVSPRVRVPAVIMLLFGLANGTLTTFVPLFIKSTHVGLNPGLFYTAAAIASFTSRIFTGRASDHYGRGLFITISLIFYTGAMLLLAVANSATAFLLAGVIEGAGGGTLLPMISTLMTDRSLPQERGRILAVCSIGFDLGIAIAGPVLGSVAQQGGYRQMFDYAALLTFFATVIFLTQSSKNLLQSFRFAIGRTQDVYALNFK